MADGGAYDQHILLEPDGEKSHYRVWITASQTDVVIIGGASTGVTCAYCLAKKAKARMIEAGVWPRHDGQYHGEITVQHGIIYYKTEKSTAGSARDYFLSQKSALISSEALSKRNR